MDSATVYFYWGNERLSFLRYMTLYSACKYNKNVVLVRKRGASKAGRWKTAASDDGAYIDYTPRLDELKNLQTVYFEDFGIPLLDVPDIVISDILTWYLLARYGGTVADMDILFIKEVPPVTYDIGLIKYPQTREGDIYPVGFLQGRQNGVFESIYKASLVAASRGTHQCAGADLLKKYIPGITTSGLDVRWLPHTMVYPFAEFVMPGGLVRMSLKRTFILDCKLPDDCIGLHWYGGARHQVATEMTEDNYKQFPCTISRLIDGVLNDGN